MRRVGLELHLDARFFAGNHVVFGPIQLLEKFAGRIKNPVEEQAHKKRSASLAPTGKTRS
jgi:hypothetical protein